MAWMSRLAPAWAIIGTFLILAFSAIAAARDFLMPVTMALLLFFVFTPFRRWIQRHGLPQWVAATIVSIGLIFAVIGSVFLMTGPASDLINSAPTFAYKIEAKFGDTTTGPLAKIKAFTDRIDRLTGADQDPTPESKVGSSTDVLIQVAELGPVLLTQTIFVLLLLFFMIASGDLLYLKIVQSFPTLSSKKQAFKALREIEQSLGSYFSTITLINIGLGIAIGCAMALWGLPAPVFFGVCAFLLNFIPYFGVAAGTASAVIVALVTLDGFGLPMLVGASYVAICSIEGNLITPMLVSRRLEMNTVVVFLAVALWAWLWSVVGMIVAVPLLVVARVLCDHIPGLDRLGNFLGGGDSGIEPASLKDDPEDEPKPAVAAR